MAFRLCNRVGYEVTTASTATQINFLATAEDGFQTWASAGMSGNDTTHYLIVDGNNWECGLGTYTNTTTFQRTTVFDGSSGTSRITLSGTALLYCDALNETLAGVETMWLDAGNMIPTVTNGAAYTVVELATNDVMVAGMNYDATTEENAQFRFVMPPRWDLGTVTFVPFWRHPSTATNFGVVWGFKARAYGNSDPMDSAWGTEVTSTDTGGTTNDLFIGPETSAMTVSSVLVNELTILNVARKTGNGSDNMAVDATFIGAQMRFTRTRPNDEDS